ncbi:hypothetical protein QTH89_14590 [Variovorax sp. J22G21]|uniref:hypothetical protein n=1 Tax=Variovorax fucosicus TaxID=3053517 RepID=UPI002578E692|nr:MULTISPECIES: hypothetical protein [unclassified Variovorax]MDM0037650.1 hypothetical protein [Variovorax sp. J22R193]MDM0062426.1 hypothetical protein [Variovorax sp. J22G21]
MREDIIRQALLQRRGDASDPGQTADATIAVLRLLHGELASVVGAQASTALVAHAVHRTRTTIEWTAPPVAGQSDTLLQALRNDLAARTSAECLLAGETLISVLVDHLISLIGEPLTLRMLNSAWGTQAADQSSQENL